MCFGRAAFVVAAPIAAAPPIASRPPASHSSPLSRAAEPDQAVGVVETLFSKGVTIKPERATTFRAARPGAARFDQARPRAGVHSLPRVRDELGEADPVTRP